MGEQAIEGCEKTWKEINVETAFASLGKGFIKWNPQEYEFEYTEDNFKVGDTITFLGTDYVGVIVKKSVDVNSTLYDVLGFHDSGVSPDTKIDYEILDEEFVKIPLEHFLISCLNARIQETDFDVITYALLKANEELKDVKVISVTGLKLIK